MGLRDLNFNVFPAIDIRGGHCVRLTQGDFGRVREYGADPVEQAREWERRGAQAIHVVDLDGAKEGWPVQLRLIRDIVRAIDVPVQVGGGIRTIGDLREVRDAGARWVVMGTAAVLDPELRRRAVEELQGALVVAVDARDGVVATHGWQQESGRGAVDLAEELRDDGVQAVLYTDVNRDGMDSGAALESTAALARIIPAIASGGIRGAGDISSLMRIPGVIGAVVGTALYEERVTLEELLQAVEA